MSQISKKQILELIDNLKEGTQALRQVKEALLDAIWIENIQSFGQLICVLGDYFLGLGEEYAPLVEIIERYCQNLKQVEDGGLSVKERAKACKEMLTLLQKLSFESGKLLPEDRKELVFFPYNYSMWDSLESIWRAAVDSGEFDVFVVPIPYYERNSDGSFGDMKYDGKLYSSEVMAVDWQTYDVAKRKPDVAYVHNPYDDMNRVTSIHPDFYAEHLKKHVGSLVFVPYFSEVGGTVATQFCITPVTLVADKVIAQTEHAGKRYREELFQYGKQNKLGWSKGLLEQKVLPLGSPKHDRQQESLDLEQIPSQWKSLVYREDGSRKKVLFFNTTLSAVLEYGEASLKKTEDILLFFQDKKDEIILFWRPHPLMEATLKSMRPQFYKRYQKIVQDYEKGNWGIFDDSKDFHRACAFCDGYYGDMSSVVSVFVEMGKPTMIQDGKITTVKTEG